MPLPPEGFAYFDNAATAWPRPACVAEAAARALSGPYGNPGRAGHRAALDSGRLIAEAREEAAAFFGVVDPLRACFCSGATEALNAALRGLLDGGRGRVAADPFMHNAAARPLAELARRGTEVLGVAPAADGGVDVGAFREALRAARGGTGRTVALAVWGSNVTGALPPLPELARAADEAGAILVVDAAQGAGHQEIDMKEFPNALVAVAGHKGLRGPSGTGLLLVGEGIDPADLAPWKAGGTGSASDSEEAPRFLPDFFEAGTPNLAGIAGLGAALAWLRGRGKEIRAREEAVVGALWDGLSGVPGLRLLGPPPPAPRAPVLSFVVEGLSCAEAALALEDDFGILCRAGLHCAPRAHRSLGTFPSGAIRYAPSFLTTDEEVDRAIAAARALADRGVGRGAGAALR